MITAIVSRNDEKDSYVYVVQVLRNGDLYRFVTKKVEIVPWGLDKNQLRFDDIDGDKKYFLIDNLIMA